MNEPKILSFSVGTVIECPPPERRNICPHIWFSEESKRRYHQRLEEKGFFELYLSKQAAEKIINHSKKLGRLRREALGFLLGDVCVSENDRFTLVRDIVTGPLKTYPDRVRFDRESISKLFSELDSSGFEYVIVGWYHSHPGYGCFMSKVDHRTQATMFSEDYHSAVVVDPINRGIEAFKLREGSVEPIEFAIYWHELETPYGPKMIKRRRRAKSISKG